MSQAQIIDEAFDEVLESEPRGWLPAWITETPYWAVSAVVHLLLLLILAGVVLLDIDSEPPPDRTVVRAVAPPPPPPDPQKRWIQDQKPSLEKETPENVVIRPELTVEPPTPDECRIPADVALQLPALAMGISGLPACFSRRGTGRASYPPGAEDAVRKALEWLMRHQHPDGHFSSQDFGERCAAGRACTHETPSHTDGRGWSDHDVGVTGLALLAFLGYGVTHQNGDRRDFRRVVKDASRWLKKVQVKSTDPRTNGRFGPGTGEQWIYDHAIATMALAELLAMTRDTVRFRKSVQAATELCLETQNPGYGWRYGYREGSDTSVTGWMVLALKTSHICSRLRLIRTDPKRFEPAFAGALHWLRTRTAQSGQVGYLSPGDPGSHLTGIYPEPYPYSKQLSCMTAVSVLCRLFAGDSRRDPQIKAGVAILMRELPRWRRGGGKRRSTINFYHWYYASYALFQYGGKAWKEWSPALLETLCDHQRVGGCEDGSWDPVGEWGAAGGRVYSTAIGAMTLEVYYRFLRVEEGG